MSGPLIKYGPGRVQCNVGYNYKNQGPPGPTGSTKGLVGNSGATAMTIKNNSNVQFSNGLILNISSVPTTSKGGAGDLQGMFALDGGYIYYCFQNFNPASPALNIWNRTPQSSGTWP